MRTTCSRRCAGPRVRPAGPRIHCAAALALDADVPVMGPYIAAMSPSLGRHIAPRSMHRARTTVFQPTKSRAEGGDAVRFGEACHTGEINPCYESTRDEQRGSWQAISRLHVRGADVMMRSDERLEELSRFASGAKAKTRVYNFCTSFEQIRRQRLNDLRNENALLARHVSEIMTEVARLRRVLAG
jgi:hypothetical protein